MMYFLLNTVFALTHTLSTGDRYLGREFINDKDQKRNCYVEIIDVTELAYGHHCYEVTWTYETQVEDIPFKQWRVSSNQTNRHRSEYPSIISCALNVNGTSWGDEIYSEDTSVLYNRIFHGSEKIGRNDVDFFIKIDPITKSAQETRIHMSKFLYNMSVDCRNLRLN